MNWAKEWTALSSAYPDGAERTAAAQGTFDRTDRSPVVAVADDGMLECEGVAFGVQNGGQERRLPCRYQSPLHRHASRGPAAVAAAAALGAGH